MRFTISDVVEMGHSKFTGGSVKIDFIFEQFVEPAPYLKIIDALDHCLVTDVPALQMHSSRHFLLTESRTLYEDVVDIMIHLIEKVRETDSTFVSPTTMVVSLDKFSFSKDVGGIYAVSTSVSPSRVQSYSIEG